MVLTGINLLNVLRINLIADHNTFAFLICSVVMGSLINQLIFFRTG